MKEFSRRNFVLGAALASFTGVAALSGCTPQPATDAGSGDAKTTDTANTDKKTDAKEGEKKEATGGKSVATTGEAVGKNGHIELQVITNNGKVEHILPIEYNETGGLGDQALKRISQQVVESQTLNVDAVAGATLSSFAVTSAIGKALDAAGEDHKEWEKREKAKTIEQDKIEDSYDVVVVGAGGAGFAAAISAAKKEKKVLLVEKLGVFGGSTALSGGEMAVPGNWIQKQEGIEDSPENLANDILKGGDNEGDPELVKVIANGALESSQWLTFEAGVPWEQNLLFFGGHSIKRSIIPANHTGATMTTRLKTRADEIDNLTVVYNTKAVELKAEGDKISGIKLQNTLSEETKDVACKAVILTAGGFGANVEMRTKANPMYGDKFKATTSIGSEGDAINMATAIGAGTIDMEFIQAYPVCDTETGALIYVGDMRLDERAIMINKEGKRFVEELERRDVLSNAILEQTDEVGYMIWDKAGAETTKLLDIHKGEYESLEARNLIAKGETVEEVAKKFEIDAAALQETLDQWNKDCEAGKDSQFNYRGKMNPIKDGPFWILKYGPAVHYTMGGIHINTDAQVLNESGAPIAGLYAAGECAGGKMGTNRLGSTSMTDIYTFGRIAGNNAADYIQA